MKNALIYSFVAFSLMTTTAFAQVSATATATADIVAPITISKTADLNFGVVARGNVSGWVLLSPSGTRTPSGGASILSQSGTVTPASFTVTGEGNFTYAITLPNIINITNTTGSGGETMEVKNFTSLPAVATGGTLNAGTQTLYVGAELAMSGNQVTGVYVSGTPFTVTVNYN